MSLASHIVIPLVKNSRALQEATSPIHQSSSPSFLKQENAYHSIFWKKSISAFSQFKPKQQRIPLQKDSPSHHYAYQSSLIAKPYIQLVNRSHKDSRFHSEIKGFDRLKCCCDYFDPNTAPLYEYSLNQVIDSNEKTCRQNWSSQQMEGQYQQIKSKPIQVEEVEEYKSIEVIMECREDDPFWIIRKLNIKKLGKVTKTKYIKKEDTQRGRIKIMQLYNLPQYTNKGFYLNSDKVRQDLKMGSRCYRKMANASHQYRRKVSRHIQTLSQILKRSKQNYQLYKQQIQRDLAVMIQKAKR